MSLCIHEADLDQFGKKYDWVDLASELHSAKQETLLAVNLDQTIISFDIAGITVDIDFVNQAMTVYQRKTERVTRK